MHKLKRLKVELKALNKDEFSDVQVNATKFYQELIRVHNLVHEHPRNMEFTAAERKTSIVYRRAEDIYLSFSKQKSKAHWID